MIPGGFVAVPVEWCPHCEQHLPADHECPGDLEALIRAIQDDYQRYGSPSDIDFQ